VKLAIAIPFGSRDPGLKRQLLRFVPDDLSAAKNDPGANGRRWPVANSFRRFSLECGLFRSYKAPIPNNKT
jgi:hypothetical protein